MARRFLLFVFLLITISGFGGVVVGAPTFSETPARPLYDAPEPLPYLSRSDQDGLPVDPTESPPTAPSLLVPFSRLTFQSYISDNWEIYTSNDDGSNLVRLTADPLTDMQPRLNRGANRLVFVSRRPGKYQLFVMNADGSGLRQLTSTSSDNVNPAWSPDGTRIAFQSYRDGQSEIYVMNADGSGQKRLTVEADYDGSPAWSPDGTKLAFISRRTGGYRVYVMNADGSGLSQLSNQPYSNNPVWSPDGGRIAYDAEGNGDGWQEVWSMNADGSNQQMLYYPSQPQTDAWVRSWSPDGRYIAFTRISYVLYQGTWYWTRAFLDAADANQPWLVARLSPNDRNWNPDWQTLDAIPPTSAVQSLPGISPATINVQWSGADSGPSGLKNFDIQVRQGATGSWQNWLTNTTATSAVYTGLGGQSYYFRSRAKDNASNIEPWPLTADAATTVESLPPNTAVSPLPAFSRAGEPLTVVWGGVDPGGSGIAGYDVQYRLNNGVWTTWQNNVTVTTAVFPEQAAAQSVAFRVRGRDTAQNLEAWPPGNGDTTTTFYDWGLSGVVLDNRDIPVGGVTVQAVPAAIGAPPSDSAGQYAAYLDETKTYNLNWTKAGYGPLPATTFRSTSDQFLNIILPPAGNLVQDGGFESGDPTGAWLPGGSLSPTLLTNPVHSGQQALRLGGEPFEPVVNVSNSPGPVTEAEMVVDESGVVHALWLKTNGLYYARQEPGNAWSSPEAVYQPPTGNTVFMIDLTSGPDGTAHALWIQYVAAQGMRLAYYAYRPGGGSWSAPQPILAIPWPELFGPAYTLEALVSDSGVVHVIWALPQQIWHASRTAGVWTVPKLAGGTGPSWETHDPQFAIDDSGGLHISWWLGGTNDSYALRYVYRPPGGNWPAQSAGFGTGNWECPAANMAVEPNGTVHLVWCYEGGSIYYANGSQGTFGSSQRISTVGVFSTNPRLALASNGGLHIIWDAAGQLAYRYRNAQGTFSAVETAALAMGERPWLAVGQSGGLHAAWQAEVQGETALVYARRSSSGYWSPAVMMTSGGPFGSVTLAAGSGGTANILWTAPAGSAMDVFYDRTRTVGADGDGRISQYLTLPEAMVNPTLSFLFQLGGATPQTGLNVRLDDGSGPTTLLTAHQDQSDWGHHWLDLTPWAGQGVTLTYQLNEAGGNWSTWAVLDEVSVGPTYPDLWLSLAGPGAASPGQDVVLVLEYGNRGAVAGEDVSLTLDLPAELLFQSASLPPTSTSPLTWDLGTLPGQGGASTIVIRARVAPNAPGLTTITVGANVAGPQEVELGNNNQLLSLLIAFLSYLPNMQR